MQWHICTVMPKQLSAYFVKAHLLKIICDFVLHTMIMQIHSLEQQRRARGGKMEKAAAVFLVLAAFFVAEISSQCNPTPCGINTECTVRMCDMMTTQDTG